MDVLPELARTYSMNTENQGVPEFVKTTCQALEQEYGFKVLFAVERSSHTWALNNADSDWDVKYVYVYPLARYLSCSKGLESSIKHQYGKFYLDLYVPKLLVILCVCVYIYLTHLLHLSHLSLTLCICIFIFIFISHLSLCIYVSSVCAI